MRDPDVVVRMFLSEVCETSLSHLSSSTFLLSSSPAVLCSPILNAWRVIKVEAGNTSLLYSVFSSVPSLLLMSFYNPVVTTLQPVFQVDTLAVLRWFPPLLVMHGWDWALEWTRLERPVFSGLLCTAHRLIGQNWTDPQWKGGSHCLQTLINHISNGAFPFHLLVQSTLEIKLACSTACCCHKGAREGNAFLVNWFAWLRFQRPQHDTR